MSYGRLKIYSDAKEITAQNVFDEVNKAYALHVQNRADIKKCGNIIGEKQKSYKRPKKYVRKLITRLMRTALAKLLFCNRV